MYTVYCCFCHFYGSAHKLEQFLSLYLCFLWFVPLSFLLFIDFFLRFFPHPVSLFIFPFLYLFIYCSVFPALSLLVSFVVYLPLCLSSSVSSCPGVISFLTLLYRCLPWTSLLLPTVGWTERRPALTKVPLVTGQHNGANARPLGTNGGRSVWRRLEQRDEATASISTWNSDRRNKQNYS